MEKNKEIIEDELMSDEMPEGVEAEIVDEVHDEETNDDSNDEIENLKTQLIRLQADFSNYKKRVEKEKESWIELGVRKLATDILPVLDNLERALNSIEEHGSTEETWKGISLIDDQMLAVLEKNKITMIEAEGEKFDHNFHHAVATEEVEGVDPDTVIDVLQNGFKINDTVIRPSMVRVSK